MMGLSLLQLGYVLESHPIFLRPGWIFLTENIIELLHPAQTTGNILKKMGAIQT